jgi:hypothetical protein
MTHQSAACDDGVTLLEHKINTVQINTEALTDASTEVDVEVKTEKTKYVLMSRHQNAGQNHNRKIANISFETVSDLKYLGTAVTDQDLINE